MLGFGDIALILLGVIAFAALSRRLETSMVTLPMVFAAFGWLIGQGGAELVPMHAEHEIIHTIAEITLILVLFADASRVDLRALRSHYAIPARMLLVGMPLTILLGTLLAHWVTPDASWAVALLVAAILTPTDAALGQTVVTSPAIPPRLRQGINVESGLNDGLALPVVMIAAIISAQGTGTVVEGVPDNVVVFALMQVVLGPLAGVVIGYLFARMLDAAINARFITTPFQGIYFLATAFLAFVAAELAGGNGLIAAFVGGLVFGHTLRSSTTFISEFMEGEGQLLTMFTFLIFGAVMVPLGIEHVTWKTVVLAIAYLSVIRVLPVWLSLAGSGLSSYEKIFLGWFGPRGLASILFALLILERFAIPGGDEILSCVVLTVMLSIVLHGVSANPMAGRFAQRTGLARPSSENP
ncbi:sodium:proton antiporter [Salinisphaera sp. P385]|uniref:Sodium:proton antiporter n=1 Tax=Spectribacter acetivorans TaxID=3075603 RepID=A0ABU3B804_9GAMM|nr:sodium:proton antiporter [Salinisphaera sp. P385]MDT0618610.1 sodium:proton antiporter [Salinisphaera sp. P385]